MITLYDRRSERYVQVEAGKTLSDYWGQCHWHSHGVKEVEPDSGPQNIHDLFAASDGNTYGPLYTELSRPSISSKPYAQTLRVRIERLVLVYRDLEHVQSMREDVQATTRKDRVWDLMGSALKEQDEEDLKVRIAARFSP